MNVSEKTIRGRAPFSIGCSSIGRIVRSESSKKTEMAKTPIRMKAVVYGLSPFQQKVMAGLWNDLPNKISHKVTDNWISATLLLGPLFGISAYVTNYQEKEKLSHRF